MKTLPPHVDRRTPRTMEEAFGSHAELFDPNEYTDRLYDLTLIVIGVVAITFSIVWILLGN